MEICLFTLERLARDSYSNVQFKIYNFSIATFNFLIGGTLFVQSLYRFKFGRLGTSSFTTSQQLVKVVVVVT